jgi:hypothetical protein
MILERMVFCGEHLSPYSNNAAREAALQKGLREAKQLELEVPRVLNNTCYFIVRGEAAKIDRLRETLEEQGIGTVSTTDPYAPISHEAEGFSIRDDWRELLRTYGHEDPCFRPPPLQQ